MKKEWERKIFYSLSSSSFFKLCSISTEAEFSYWTWHNWSKLQLPLVYWLLTLLILTHWILIHCLKMHCTFSWFVQQIKQSWVLQRRKLTLWQHWSKPCYWWCGCRLDQENHKYLLHQCWPSSWVKQWREDWLKTKTLGREFLAACHQWLKAQQLCLVSFMIFSPSVKIDLIGKRIGFSMLALSLSHFQYSFRFECSLFRDTTTIPPTIIRIVIRMKYIPIE